MMHKISFLLITILLLSCSSGEKKISGQVEVENGIIQGIVADDLIIFKGVPFAEPPVGDLRWKAPQLTI